MHKHWLFVVPALLSAGTSVVAEMPVAPVQKGLWLADIPLCADPVVGLVSEPGLGGAENTLLIELTVQAGARFAELTAGHVGERAAISLNGEVIQAPHINEPILGGRVAITGLDAEQIARVSATAMALCPVATGETPAHT